MRTKGARSSVELDSGIVAKEPREDLMLPPDLAQFVEQYHRALETYASGDPDSVMRLFSRREDVTLANPLGPPVRGWDRVEEAARRAGAQIRDGEDNQFERISEFATADLGYIVEIHRASAKLGGAAERAPFALRITTIFRREEGEWRIAHRHADPISAPRPIESVVEQ